MAVRVSPDEAHPTHHLSLEEEDGKEILGIILCDARGKPDKKAISRTPLQSTSLKISEGNPKHSDFELPFTPIAQEDWSGGRGNEMYESNITRFLDSRRLDTLHQGKAFLGGRESYSTGHRVHHFNLPGSVKWQAMLPGDRRYLANHFTTVAGFDADAIYILVKRRGTPTGPLTVVLCSDSPGDPGAVLKTITLTVADVPDVLGILQLFDPASETLAAATKFWIKVYGPADDVSEDHWQIGVNATSGTSKESSDDAAWTASGVDLYFRIKNADDPWSVIYYDYKGQLYCVTVPDDGSAPQIFMNGYRGAADSNNGNLSRLNDGTQSWTADELVGGIAYITGGPGSLEGQPWREITSNDASYAVVDPPWEIEHTTDTEYVILGLDTWREIGAHGMTVPVTDFMISKDVIYYALGEATNIRRHREYNNGGVWSESDFDDDGTNKSTFLRKVHDSADGIELWRAKNDVVEVSKASAEVWGVDLTFAAGIPTGDLEDKYSGIVQYIDPSYGDKILWCLKRGSLYALKDDKPDMVQLDEMRAVMSEKNGRAFLVHDVYMYWSLLDGIERYYNDVIDDVGPNRDRGLPADRQGPCFHMVGYPGRYYAAYDAGPSGYSSILMSSGSRDWHEVYRCDEAGQRIRRLHIQVIPGDKVDRLWFLCGQDLLWLPISLNPTQDVNYPFTHEGTLITSRMYCGMQDILKLWYAFKVMADRLEEDVCWIEVDYKIDDEDDDWTMIEKPYIESPKQTETIGGVDKWETGGFCILRMRFQSSDYTKTPLLRATVTKSISRLPIKHGYACAARLRDEDVDLQGDPDDREDVDDKILLLDKWANSLTVLKMRSVSKAFDDLDVFIDDTRLRLYFDSEGQEIEGYIGTIPITQVLSEESE